MSIWQTRNFLSYNRISCSHLYRQQKVQICHSNCFGVICEFSWTDAMWSLILCLTQPAQSSLALAWWRRENVMRWNRPTKLCRDNWRINEDLKEKFKTSDTIYRQFVSQVSVYIPMHNGLRRSMMTLCQHATSRPVCNGKYSLTQLIRGFATFKPKAQQSNDRWVMRLIIVCIFII